MRALCSPKRQFCSFNKRSNAPLQNSTKRVAKTKATPVEEIVRFLDLKIRYRQRESDRSCERKWDAILAEFFKGDFGNLGERMALEDVYDAKADSEQEGGRPLYSSSARRTFCLAARALRAARRTWLLARRIRMLLRGLGNSASRTGTAARGPCMRTVGIRPAARGVRMLARRLRSAVRGSFDLAPRH